VKAAQPQEGKFRKREGKHLRLCSLQLLILHMLHIENKW
jgi:hypothetical protein